MSFYQAFGLSTLPVAGRGVVMLVVFRRELEKRRGKGEQIREVDRQVSADRGRKSIPRLTAYDCA